MKLSIVIPVYNVQDYLEQCVSSVLSLKYDVEILLIDDGSTDGSGVLCDSLAMSDSRINVIHRENGGLSAARNTGIETSTGDYILFLDSDDFIDPYETEEMLRGLSEKPDILLGLYNEYYSADNTYIHECCRAFSGINGYVSRDDFLRCVPADGQSCYMVACRFIVKHDFILRNSLFFLPGIYHEDEEWTARLFSVAETVFVSQRYFYQYRQSRIGSITSRVKPKHIYDSLTILERHTSLYLQHSDQPALTRYLYDRMAQQWLNIMLNIYVLPQEERADVINTLSEYKRVYLPRLRGVKGSVADICCRLIGIRASCALLHHIKRLTARLLWL